MVGWKNGTDQAALDMLRLYFSFDYPYYPLAYHRLVVPRVWTKHDKTEATMFKVLEGPGSGEQTEQVRSPPCTGKSLSKWETCSSGS